MPRHPCTRRGRGRRGGRAGGGARRGTLAARAAAGASGRDLAAPSSPASAAGASAAAAPASQRDPRSIGLGNGWGSVQCVLFPLSALRHRDRNIRTSRDKTARLTLTNFKVLRRPRRRQEPALDLSGLLAKGTPLQGGGAEKHRGPHSAADMPQATRHILPEHRPLACSAQPFLNSFK